MTGTGTGRLFLRHLGVTVRNRTAVLIAGLTPVMLLVCWFAFLRDGLVDAAGTTGTTNSAPAAAAITAWVFATVAVLTGFSSTFAVLLAYADDRADGRFCLWAAAGAKGWQVGGTFLAAAATVAFALSLVVIALGQVWAAVRGEPTMSAIDWLLALIGSLLAAVFFAGLNGLAVALTRTRGGLAGWALLGGLGTTFLTTSLALVRPTVVYEVLGALPFFQASSLVRAPILEGCGVHSLTYPLGAEIRAGGTWPLGLVAVALLAWTAVAWALSLWRMGRTLRDPA
ncbi:MAG: hypothetical protein LBI33_07490 [Propionibacteriaceae bacterium]|jgi:hypothetical protein|nr:hypothetical protein [Propionibacteriaceae bacterium]